MEKICEILSCAVSNDHIVNEPIHLSCGHTICKTCIPNDANTFLNCSICLALNMKDLKLERTSRFASQLVQLNLPILFKKLEKTAENMLQEVKNFKKDKNEKIRSHVQYIKEEIEIKAESIKNEIDKLVGNLCNRLTIVETEIIESQDTILSSGGDMELNLNKLTADLDKIESQSQVKFYEYQENLSVMNKLIRRAQNIIEDSKLEFKESKDKISENLIGQISFLTKKKQQFESVENKLSNNDEIPIQQEQHVPRLNFEEMILENNRRYQRLAEIVPRFNFENAEPDNNFRHHRLPDTYRIAITEHHRPHWGRRCNDGSLDMRCGENRGKDKYND